MREDAQKVRRVRKKCAGCAKVRSSAQWKDAECIKVRKGCVNLRIYAFFAIFVLVWRE